MLLCHIRTKHGLLPDHLGSWFNRQGNRETSRVYDSFAEGGKIKVMKIFCNGHKHFGLGNMNAATADALWESTTIKASCYRQSTATLLYISNYVEDEDLYSKHCNCAKVDLSSPNR